MRGLIIKDLVNLKAQARVMLVLVVFYVFIAITSENTAILGGIIAVLAAMLPITAMAYDEKAKWDKYALSMPLTRTDLVLSKYILGLGFSMVAFLVNIAFNLVLGFVATNEILILCSALLGASILFISLVLPVMFKYGVEKGRIVMMILIFSPTAAVMLIQKANIAPPSQAFIDKIPYVAPVVILALLGISMMMSLKIYKVKEL